MDEIGSLLAQHGVGENWLRCVDCRWVFRDKIPQELGRECPSCQVHGLMTPFPRVEAWHLIEVVMGHAARLDPDSAKGERELLGRLETAGLPNLKAAELREMAAQARLSVERGGYDALAGVAQQLTGRGIPSADALAFALDLLVVAGQASPDVEAILVLAATALEALLDELWVEALAAFGLSQLALPTVSGFMRHSSVPRQRILLSELTEPLGVFPFDKDFVVRWDEILEHRNAVVHGRPFVVSLECAEQAVQLAADSVAAFAQANNRLLEASDRARREARREARRAGSTGAASDPASS